MGLRRGPGRTCPMSQIGYEWPCREHELTKLSGWVIGGWVRETKVGSTYGKLLLYALGTHASSHGVAFPSHEALADDIEASTKTVQRYLTEMAEAGLIFRTVYYDDGRRAGTRYVLLCNVPARFLTPEQRALKAAGFAKMRHRLDADLLDSESGSDADLLDSGDDLPDSNADLLDSVVPQNEPPSNKPLLNEPPTLDGFAAFWQAYPARDGRKVGKAKSEAYWRKLTEADRCAVLTGAKVYASERGGPGQVSPKDPERWLRDRCWVDFQPRTAPKADGPSVGAVNEMMRQVDYELNGVGYATYNAEQQAAIIAQCLAEFGEHPSERYKPNVGVIQ